MLKVSELVKKFSKVSVILTVASLIIKPATFTVLADDAEFYLPIDQYETYTAWQFFSNYGYSADESRTYTNVYTGTGSFTTSATITLTTGGGGDYADTYAGVATIDGNFIQSFQISADTYPATLYVNNPSAASYYSTTMACVSTGVTGGANTGFNCTWDDAERTQSLRLQNPWTNLLLTVEPTANTGNGSNYNLRLVSADTGHTDGAFTIQESSSGTYSGSGTFSFNMTDVNINQLKYKLPYISTDEINNDWIYGKKFSMPKKYTSGHQYAWVCSFLVDMNDVSTDYNPLDYIEGVYDLQHNKLTAGTDYIIETKSLANGGLSKKSIKIYSNSGAMQAYIKFKTGNNGPRMPLRLIPLFVGHDYELNEDLYRYIFGESVNKEIIDDVTNQNDQFDNVGNNLTSFESSSESSMNNSLSYIPLNNGIGTNSNFLNSALWVKNRFQDLVVNTPFELVIVFSLTLGIALTIVGKLRNR